MNNDMRGKTAIVTGASKGIGAQIAIELASRGAKLLLVARGGGELLQVAQQISDLGGEAATLQCDLSNTVDCDVLVKAIKEISPIHILVNNVGTELVAPLQATGLDRVRSLFEINVFSIIGLTRSCLRLMERGGSIINMASVAGLKGAPGMSVYSSTKGAIIAFTKSLALELAGRQIRVNAVAPGIVESEMSSRMFRLQGDAYKESISSQHPLGIGSTTDVAKAVAFLASDDARWITGQVLTLDGGFSA